MKLVERIMMKNTPERLLTAEKKQALDNYLLTEFTTGRALTYGYVHEKALIQKLGFESIPLTILRDYLAEQGFIFESAEALPHYNLIKLPY